MKYENLEGRVSGNMKSYEIRNGEVNRECARLGWTSWHLRALAELRRKRVAHGMLGMLRGLVKNRRKGKGKDGVEKRK